MATEGLKVDNQDSLEALQREADELKKRLEEEKAKLKDVDSKIQYQLLVNVYSFIHVINLFPCKGRVIDNDIDSDFDLTDWSFSLHLLHCCLLITT